MAYNSGLSFADETGFVVFWSSKAYCLSPEESLVVKFSSKLQVLDLLYLS